MTDQLTSHTLSLVAVSAGSKSKHFNMMVEHDWQDKRVLEQCFQCYGNDPNFPVPQKDDCATR